MRPPRVGERIRVHAGVSGNGYYSKSGEMLTGMEGPYQEDIVWDQPWNAWGTYDPQLARERSKPRRLLVDPHQLRSGDLVLYVTVVAKDQDDRPVVVLDIERPPE